MTLSKPVRLRVHVSGDERYALFINGARVGLGSERGDLAHWYFETYDLELPASDYVFVGKVWSLAGLAPIAQLGLRHGFILAPDDVEFLPLLGTGVACWEYKVLGGFGFVQFPGAEGAGAKVIMDGKGYDWDFESGAGNGWQPVVRLEKGVSALRCNDYGAVHLMTPATLPPMKEQPRGGGVVRMVEELETNDPSGRAINGSHHKEHEGLEWNSMLAGTQALSIPPHTRRRVLIDLEDYVCAYPELTISGGAGSEIRVHWAEALLLSGDGSKGNRDEVEGKLFRGLGDTFRPDGGEHRQYEPLWWESGRYVEVCVHTGGDRLIIESLIFRETGYPLDMESEFEADDPRLEELAPLLLRSLKMCAHETYIDCPYYEQLMYAGDTRTEILVTYAISTDDRLPRKSLSAFAYSRLSSGLTQSRYPSRVTQRIPPFSLWWVAMLHDYARWRGDAGFVRELMPVARGVIDCFIDHVEDHGLLRSPRGWNFTDWVEGWRYGVPPDGDGISGIINLQLLLVLRLMRELETFCGRPELAAQAERRATELALQVERAFWDQERGLFADDLGHSHFSEHAQCLAILGESVAPDRRDAIARSLKAEREIRRTSIYFSHYLFDAWYALGDEYSPRERLAFWFGLRGRGLKTTPETADPCRSECHAWGAHPLYHYFASILGIRPAAMGFEVVRIAPQLGALRRARGKMVHPLGRIEVEFESDSRAVSGRIVLPPGLRGVFAWGGRTIALREGTQRVEASVENSP